MDRAALPFAREDGMHWRRIVEMIAQPAWTATADGGVDYVNPHVRVFTGLRDGDLLGRGWLDALHPDDRPSVERAWTQAVAERRACRAEHRLRRADGAYGRVSFEASPVHDGAGQLLSWIGLSLDVSERKEEETRAEGRTRVEFGALKSLQGQLRRTQELVELAVHGSGVSLFEFELPDGTLENSSNRLTNFWEPLGYDPTEVPTTFADAAQLVLLPADLERVPRAMQAYLSGQAPTFDIEHQVRHKDGSLQWRLARGKAVRDAKGTAVRFVGTHVDITERKRIEGWLQESEHRWRSLAEALPQLIWTAAADGTIEYMSAQACAYTGRTEQELLGDGWANAIHPDELAQTAKSWFASVAAQRPHEVQHRLRRFDGVYKWFTTRAEPARDASGQVIKWIGSSTDITALKELEEANRKTKERLELSIRGSNVALFDFDMPDGNIVNARQTMINVWETLGYDAASAPTEFVPGAILAIHPDDLAYVQGQIQTYLDGSSKDFEVEYRVRHRDGSVLWRLARGTAFRDETGKPTRFLGSFFDITDKKQIEERLRESETRWRSLAETLPQFVFTTRADGMVDYFGAQATEYTGRPESALLGSGWVESLHPDDREFTANAWMEAIEQQREHEVEHRIRRKDGEYRWFTTRAAAVRDEEGRIFKWFGTCTDITNFKELEAELRRTQERLELGVQSSGVSVFHLEMPDGAIEDSRHTTNVWRSLGYDSAAEAPSALGVVHSEDVGRVAEELRAYLSGQTKDFETEHRVRHKDGTYRWLLTRGVALRDSHGVPIRVVGASVDITDRKRIEGELERAREAAESANRAKDEFLANVSHEIRTPMNAILGMTELALDSARTDHQRQLLSTVKSAARNLLGIINDLLDFSKIAAGKLALDRADFSLRVEVDDTLRALAVRAHRKGLELACHVRPDVPDALLGDAGRLRQVLMNLVGNAIKFTAEGEVVVEVRTLTAPKSDTVDLAFRIIDTGIGIAPENQATIFRAFEQEDSSTTRRFGGTGLGLTISAQIAALMDGAITVTSTPGRGSTFEFTCRFALSSRPDVGSLEASPKLLDGLRVLVVDDRETNRRILTEWLTSWRMRTVAVGDGKTVFEELARAEDAGAPYSLVLLDARMPDVDGITLAVQILERYRRSPMRLILLSSDDSPTLATRSRDVGISAYLLKPVQQSELLETIAVVMNTSAPSDPALPAGAGKERDASPPPARASLRVLVAEDNELNVALLQELLSQRGHRAQFVGDGRSALARVTEERFDLLLLDLHMPEMDGFEVVEGIREREQHSGEHLPIIALTARSSSRDRARCAAAGMDDFLSKPIEADALWAAVDRMTAAFPLVARRETSLLDARAILRACGGRSAVLERLRDVFRRSLPEQLAQVRLAAHAADLPRLREAAHKLNGTLGAFSTVAGAVALAVEDAATRDDLESCTGLVERLESMCADLLEETRALRLDSLTL